MNFSNIFNSIPGFESQKQIDAKAKAAIDKVFDNDFEEKYKRVKPVLDMYEKTGKLETTQLRVQEYQKSMADKEVKKVIGALRDSQKGEQIRNELKGKKGEAMIPKTKMETENLTDSVLLSGIEDEMKGPAMLLEQKQAVEAKLKRLREQLEDTNTDEHFNRLSRDYRNSQRVLSELKGEQEYLMSQIEGYQILQKQLSERYEDMINNL